MPKIENVTFYNYAVVTADGQRSTAEYKSEKQYNEAKTDAAKVGSSVEELKAQTFAVTSAESIDEILEVVPNPKVALDYFNYGLTLAQHNVKRDLMRDAEWQPIEGVYNLLGDVQAEKQARVADPLAASRRSLKALWEKNNPGVPLPSDDEINAVIEQFSKMSQAAA